MGDLRCASRQLLRRPAWSALAIGVLALAIGAATAVFAVVDAVLFEPVAAHEPERLVRVFASDEENSYISNTSLPGFRDLEHAIPAFEAAAAYASWLPLHVAQGDGAPQRASGALVAGDYFGVLGTRPAVGRLLATRDDAPGAAPVAVLGHHAWRDAYASDPGVVGRVVRINGQAVTIVGVTEPGFRGADSDGRRDYWLPMAAAEIARPGQPAEQMQSRNFSWLDVVARLAPGATLEQAGEQLRALALARREGQPKEQQEPLLRVVPASEAAVDAYGTEGTRRLAWMLVAAVLALLVIGCVDVMGLLFVRREERRRELAVRLGVGAPPRRLVRQMLVEAGLLVAIATALGIALAHAAVAALASFGPASLALPIELSPGVANARVLGAVAALALVALLLSALAPALGAARAGLAEAIRAQSSQTVGHGRDQGRSALLAGQIALSLVLVCASAVLWRSLSALAAVEPGYEPRGAAMAAFDLSLQGYEEPRGRAFQAALLERLEAAPGIESAALAKVVPVSASGMNMSFQIDGTEVRDPDGSIAHASLDIVSPGFFDTLGASILRGRDFTDADSKDSERVAIVSRAMAERYFPGGNAIDRTIGRSEEAVRIVGIASDLALRDLGDPAPVVIYRPATQFHMGAMSVVVRTAPGREAEALDTVRATVASIDATLPLYATRSLEDQIGQALAQARVVTGLIATFGATALVLSVAGAYGVFAYSVRARRREFGLRLALGASPRAILALVLGQGARVLVAGVLLGLAASLAAVRALAALPGVSAYDPVGFVAAVALVAAVVLVALALPARQATRVDPQETLRCD